MLGGTWVSRPGPRRRLQKAVGRLFTQEPRARELTRADSLIRHRHVIRRPEVGPEVGIITTVSETQTPEQGAGCCPSQGTRALCLGTEPELRAEVRGRGGVPGWQELCILRTSASAGQAADTPAPAPAPATGSLPSLGLSFPLCRGGPESGLSLPVSRGTRRDKAWQEALQTPGPGATRRHI